MTTRLQQFLDVSIYILLVAVAGLQITSCRQSPMPASFVEAPSDVGASSPSLSEISVTWINPVLSEPYHVHVEYKKELDVEYSVAGTVTNVSDYMITGVAADTNYNIRLKTVVDSDGEESEYSPVVTINTTDEADETSLIYLKDLAASVVAPSTIKLSWNWSNEHYDDLVSYEILRKPADYGLWSSVITVDIPDGTTPAISYSDAASGGEDVVYKIIVHYEVDADATYETEAIAYHPKMENFSVVFNNYDETQISWNWTNTNFAALNYFQVKRKKYAELTWTNVGAPVYTEPTSYVDTAPGASSVTYRFEMHYTDGTVINLDTLSTMYTAPTLTGLVATAGDGVIDLDWSWVGDHFDAIDSIEIQRKPTYYGAWTTIETIDVPFGTTPASSYSDSGSGGVPVIYKILLNYHYSTDWTSSSTISVDLPDPLSPPTGLVEYIGVYSGDIQWDYSTVATNVDKFVVHTTVTNASGVEIDTADYVNDWDVDYTYGSGDYSFYFYSILSMTECAYADAVNLTIKVQALPINSAINSASDWVELAPLPCP